MDVNVSNACLNEYRNSIAGNRQPRLHLSGAELGGMIIMAQGAGFTCRSFSVARTADGFIDRIEVLQKDGSIALLVCLEEFSLCF